MPARGLIGVRGAALIEVLCPISWLCRLIDAVQYDRARVDSFLDYCNASGVHKCVPCSLCSAVNLHMHLHYSHLRLHAMALLQHKIYVLHLTVAPALALPLARAPALVLSLAHALALALPIAH
jgi:hypothetical protein